MKLTLVGVGMDSIVTNLISLNHIDSLIDTLGCINRLEFSKYFILEF